MLKNKKHSIIAGISVAILGIVGLWKYIEINTEKKSSFNGQDNVVTFTLTNSSNSPQKVSLFKNQSTTTFAQRNPNVSIQSSSQIDFFDRSNPTDPKKVTYIEVRASVLPDLMVDKDVNSVSSIEEYHKKLKSKPSIETPADLPLPAPVTKKVAPKPVPEKSKFSQADGGINPSVQKQIIEPIRIVTKDASGKESITPYYPTVSAYQSQSSISIVNNPNFILDGYSWIKDYIIQPKTSVTLLFHYQD